MEAMMWQAILKETSRSTLIVPIEKHCSTASTIRTLRIESSHDIEVFLVVLN